MLKPTPTLNILFNRVLFMYDDHCANLKLSPVNERVDSNCSGINTPENIRKRRRRYSSNPSPQTLDTLQEEKSHEQHMNLNRPLNLC